MWTRFISASTAWNTSQQTIHRKMPSVDAALTCSNTFSRADLGKKSTPSVGLLAPLFPRLVRKGSSESRFANPLRSPPGKLTSTLMNSHSTIHFTCSFFGSALAARSVANRIV